MGVFTAKTAEFFSQRAQSILQVSYVLQSCVCAVGQFCFENAKGKPCGLFRSMGRLGTERSKVAWVFLNAKTAKFFRKVPK
jgi:hypothetical protein